MTSKKAPVPDWMQGLFSVPKVGAEEDLRSCKKVEKKIPLDREEYD
ncbi:MAG: hypothetical protein AAF975_09285 [Spirochaetota bacterium]